METTPARLPEPVRTVAPGGEWGDWQEIAQRGQPLDLAARRARTDAALATAWDDSKPSWKQRAGVR